MVAARRRFAWLHVADGVAVVLLGVLLALVYLQMSSVGAYATADAGHYLADSDAIMGRGVRESRHLPLFPMLLAAVRLIAAPFGAIQIGMLVVVALLFIGFYLVVRGVFDHSLGEPTGALVYAASPMVAEGVGWYGAAMLLGVAGLVPAIAAVDRALTHGGRRRIVVAIVLCGAVAWCHPLPFALLAAFGGVATTAHLVATVRGRPSTATVVKRAIAIGGGSVVVWLPVSNLYFELTSPSAFAPSLGRLGLLMSWGFRENAVLWLGLLGLGLAGPLAWPLKAAQRRLALGLGLLAAMVLTMTGLIGGHHSYTTRPLYMVTAPAALGAAWAIHRLESSAWPRARVHVTPMLAAVLVVLALSSFSSRLSTAVSYYNELTPDEVAALDWLANEPGAAVLVSPSAGDRSAATLFAWLVEGFSRRAAIGPGEPFLYLLMSARNDSLDAERYLAGESVLEAGGLRVGSEPGGDVVTIQGRVSDDWIPLWTISTPLQPHAAVSAPSTDAAASRMTMEPSRRLTITVEEGSAQVRLRLWWDPAQIGLHLQPARFTPSRIVSEAPLVVRQASPAGPIETTFHHGTGVQEISPAVPDRSLLVTLFASGGPGETSLEISGLDDPSPHRASYTATELAHKHEATHVITWRGSEEYPRLLRRPCLTPAFQRGPVVVLKVVCDAPG